MLVEDWTEADEINSLRISCKELIEAPATAEEIMRAVFSEISFKRVLEIV